MKQSGRLFQPEPRNSKAKLFSQVIVRAKHIHRNDFHLTTNSSIAAQKVISDDSLCPAFKDSDDIELVKILCNETHLHLPIETVTPLTVSTSQDIISGSRLKSCLKWKSLSLRMTVEVEMASWISNIGHRRLFNQLLSNFLVDNTRDLVILLDDRSLGDHHFRAVIAPETEFSTK